MRIDKDKETPTEAKLRARMLLKEMTIKGYSRKVISQEIYIRQLETKVQELADKLEAAHAPPMAPPVVKPPTKNGILPRGNSQMPLEFI